MKKILFFGLAALVAAGIVSCSKDAADGGGKPLEKDTSFFVNIAINGTETMTRADEPGGEMGPYDSPEDYNPGENPNFENGNSDENKISSIYLIFYDEDGNRVSTTQVRRNSNQTDNSYGQIIYKGVVQVDVKHGSKVPASVMAFVNPITSTNFDINPDFATLEAMEKVTRPRIIDDNNYFAMSKSVYYRKKTSTSRDAGTEKESAYERITVTPLTEGAQLFPTEEKAQEAMDSTPETSVVNIYVERYAAKVSFSFNEETMNADVPAKWQIQIDQETLKFVPEYWAVNAYESETYVTKSFFDGFDPGTLQPTGILTYEEMDEVLAGGPGGTSWWWNSEQYHRCYWAQTPAYYMENYPRVADDIIDQMTYAAGGFALGYYSYDEMQRNAEKKLISKARDLQDATDKAKPIYARENTVAGKALIAAYEDPSASPKAAIASVVLVGHYEVTGKELKDGTFYILGNKTNGYSFFDYDGMLNFFMASSVRFAKDKYGYDLIFNYDDLENLEFKEPDYKKYFTIKHPDMAARGDLVIDSRFVTIQLDEEQIDDNPVLYAYIDGNWTQVTQDNLYLVNRQMLYSAGTAQGFEGGKAYFTIPIKHLGYYRTDNDNAGKTANDKEFDWTAVRSGDFGLVRNHSYSIIVDKIEGLGNGIPHPDHPIVPPTDPEEYFIGARIVVLNWAVVPEQHVTL